LRLKRGRVPRGEIVLDLSFGLTDEAVRELLAHAVLVVLLGGEAHLPDQSNADILE
jgi:hypothetical protein